MFSPTGYYAHYRFLERNANGEDVFFGTETYPVVGFTDQALVINSDGMVVTTEELKGDLVLDSDEYGGKIDVKLFVTPKIGE